MKKLIGNLVRVLVSVGILVYLFNNILCDETETAFQAIADSPQAPAATLAAPLHLSVTQVEQIRARCIVPDSSKDSGQAIDLTKLTRRDRVPLVWRFGPQHLHESFQRISLVWFGLAIASVGIVLFFGIVRWQWILQVQGLELPFWRACSITLIGSFFNSFMLGATGGDVMKAWYVARETHHKKAEAVATVIVDRIIGLLGVFVVALVMMGMFYHRVFDDVRLRTFAIITLGVVFATVAITIAGLWKGAADRFPGVRSWLQKIPKYDTLRRMVDAYRVYASHPAVLLKTFLVTIGVHVFSMLSIVCVGKGLGITEAGLVDYFLYLPIINSVAAIPITISGFGLREGMYVAMFSRVGVPGAAALAMSLLGYLATLFWSVVGAGFYLTHRKELPSVAQIETEA